MKIEILKSKSAFSNHLKNIDFHIFLGTSTEMHRHLDYYEIFYITKGPVNYYVNDQKLTLNRGDMSIVRVKDMHKFDNPKSDNTQHVNLAVKIELFNVIARIIDPFFLEKLNSNDNPPVISLTDFELKEVEYWKRKINTAKSYNPEEMFSHITTLLCLAVSILNGKYSYENYNMPTWFSSLIEQINASEFVSKNVLDIYDLCGFSPPLVIKTFKQYLNQTPIQYLTSVKVNYACNLLRNTDYSIIYISNKIGYDSLSHFNRVFKKLKGETPSVYRAKFKIKDNI